MISANYNELKWGLEELSNKEEQLRLWCGVANESNEISSLSEASCSVFNYDVERILSNKQASFSLPIENVSLLRELSKKLKAIPSGLSPLEQVEHPEMEEVRRLASDLLAQLHREELPLDR